jgi:uncharacterized protein YcnI
MPWTVCGGFACRSFAAIEGFFDGAKARDTRMRLLSIVGTILLASSAARADVALDRYEAPQGEPLRTTIRVNGGCAGSATTAVRVRIPDGVTDVKPMPKTGWVLSTQPIRSGSVEISWSGGKLPDAWYDEFVFVATMPATPGKTLLFPVLQSCEQGEIDWSENPAISSVRATRPAPYLLLTR